jgi:hypothetical protein
MALYVNPLIHNTMLDANLIDEVVSGTNPAVNRIVELSRSGEDINIVLPYSVREELSGPTTPPRVRAAADLFPYSCCVELTALEIASRDRLVKEAKGNSEIKNVERDLHHIFETGKYGGGQFITRDRWLLRNTKRIAHLAQVEAVTPEHFVEKVDEALERRAAQQRRSG